MHCRAGPAAPRVRQNPGRSRRAAGQGPQAEPAGRQARRTGPCPLSVACRSATDEAGSASRGKGDNPRPAGREANRGSRVAFATSEFAVPRRRRHGSVCHRYLMVRHIKLLPDAGSTTLSDQIIMFVSMPSDEPTGANGPNEYAPNRCGRRNSASLPGDPSLAAEARRRPGGNNHRRSGYAVRDGRLAAHRPPQQVPGQVCGGGHPCHFAGTEQTGGNP